MRIVGILQIVLAVVGIAAGLIMFGDIGIAALIGAFAALLSGIGILVTARALERAKLHAN